MHSDPLLRMVASLGCRFPRFWGQFLDEGLDRTLKENQHGPRSQEKAAPAAHHPKELADKKEVSPPKPKG
jgi:hypothetical protein